MGALLYDPQKSSLRTRVDFALPINEIGVGGVFGVGGIAVETAEH